MESLVLNKDNVKLKVKASDWEEAVRIGAGMLVEQGCAKQSYVDGIIASVKELGPYIVIADGIAMPHTRPEQGAIGIGCSLITLDQPVKFDGDDSEVKVMICFSAVDSESHMDILKMIVEFVERGLIDDIAKATTYEEFKDTIENRPGFVKAMWCGDQACEDEIKDRFSASSRCMPFDQEQLSDTCVCCGKPAKSMVIWGKAY